MNTSLDLKYFIKHFSYKIERKQTCRMLAIYIIVVNEMSSQRWISIPMPKFIVIFNKLLIFSTRIYFVEFQDVKVLGGLSKRYEILNFS